MTRSKLLFVLLFCAFFGNAFAQDCPRIYRSGDTLKTDPAGGYQWFLNGNIIPNATKQWHLGTVKGDYSVEISGASPVFTVNNQGKSIYGRIIDERYEPLVDAKITVGGKTVSSDNQGLFSLTNLDIKGTTAVLTIEKAGFWKNTQRLTFFDGKEANLTAMLEPLRVTNRFDAQKGATISERGFFLTFPPNSAVNEKGEIYTGTINLSLKRAFPAEEGFGYRMPGGDFSAIDANGQEKILISYGFMSAEMQGANGEKLNLAKDKEATLEFYIPWEQNKTAPDSMPLWHFDEATAVWKPEGTARKVGPRYMGTVKHFSSWNCDVPTGRATVKGKVVNCKKQPPSIRIPVQVGQRNVTIDAQGYYTSFVPSATTFNVTASVDTATVTPLTEGEERTVKDLEATNVLDAVGLIDSSGTLTVYGYGVKEYSVDSGKTFQPKNQKLTFKESYPMTGVARDSVECIEVNFRIKITSKQRDCKLLDNDNLYKEHYFNSLGDAFSTDQPVYRFGIRNQVVDDITFILMDLSCLHELNLNGNQLRNISPSVGYCKNLKVLSFEDNQLTSIPENIGLLFYLESLNLSVNQLSSLPKSIWYLSNLQFLHLDKNQLSSLPDSISHLTNLKWLTLDSNLLTEIPQTIGKLTNLQLLFLTNNKITSVSEFIGQLSNLQFLGLGFNHLTNIPESIGQLTNLQTLDLQSNQLSNIPESIGQLTNLQSLFLSGNQLASVPEFLGQLNNLQMLDLIGNQLTSIPETIGQLSKLQVLGLGFNQLLSLSGSIGYLSNLQELNLTYNQLTSLPSTIANLKDNLKKLYLEGNNISPEEKAKIKSWLPNTTIIW